ncbi:MAG TPA: S9 family peptidase [Blastocatellia bacterium]|nr:S9 family peptidase [Blastocatellia bacterium]
MRRSVVALILISVLATPLLGGNQAPRNAPTIDQSLSMKMAGNPQISPDGRYVAYEVRSTNWDDNEFHTEIWVAVVQSGQCYQLTQSKKSDRVPVWSPDSKRLAFLSSRDGKDQIYLISPTGGEAVKLTKTETGVDAVRWAPDGRHIAFTASDPETKEMKDRNSRYGEFVVVGNDYTMSNLWLVDVPQESLDQSVDAKRLTEGTSFTVGDFSWSPDSTRIAFAAAREPDPDSTYTSVIYVVGVTDKSVRKVAEGPGPEQDPVWSPDGKQIAFQGALARDSFYFSNWQIGVVDAEGGPSRNLIENFDEDPDLLAWSADGIYFSALDRTYGDLYLLDPLSRKFHRISPGHLLATQFSFTADYRHEAFMSGVPNEMMEVSESELARFAPRRLTKMGDQLTQFRLASRELVQWTSTDGTPIEGVLVKPAGFDPAKKYPLLVVIHGGPVDLSRPEFRPDQYYPIENFAAKGALILEPNYRGSAGYGEKFRSLNVRNLGIGDYWDVISGVDNLIGRGIVDKDRVGAMGWSEGGYISAFITTHSDRFKAVSVGAGISDWVTYYVNTDVHPFTRQYLKATPWEDPQIYAKTSPITSVVMAKTPTLIQHGELDKRVPIPNGYLLYQALKDRSVPVRMIVYKGFGHPITKPKQQRAVMEHNYDWFSHWIWGEKMPDLGIVQ